MPKRRLCAFLLRTLLLALPAVAAAGGDHSAGGRAGDDTARHTEQESDALRIVIRFDDDDRADSPKSEIRNEAPWIDVIKEKNGSAGYGEHLDTMVYPP